MKPTLTLLTVLLLTPLAALHAAEPRATFHYQPADAFFCDPIPFYHEGVHHGFYLYPGKSLDHACSTGG